MNIPDLLKLQKKSFLVYLGLVAGFIAIFATFVYLWGFNQVMQAIEHPFLSLSEKLANGFLSIRNSAIKFDRHELFQNEILVKGFTTQYLYKKIILFYAMLIGIQVQGITRKWFYLLVLLLIQLFAVAAFNISNALLYLGKTDFQSVTILHSIVFALLNSFFLLIYLKHKDEIKRRKHFLWDKLNGIIYVCYAFSIVLFLKAVLAFKLWIFVLFETSRLIISMLGYQVVRESNLLLGEYGSISLAKDCLGIMTIFVFAAFVYLTGYDRRKQKWIYILTGFLLLNLVNIARFTLLFIHLQTHDDVSLTLDVHDVYTYITYGTVFVLWVIWIEILRRNRNPISVRG